MPPKKESSKRNKYRGIKSRHAALAKARAAKEARRLEGTSSNPEPAGISHDSIPDVALLPSTPTLQANEIDQTIPVRKSASKRKLGFFSENPDVQFTSDLPTAVVDLNLVSTLFANFPCKLCGRSLTLQCASRRGFVYSLQVVCHVCSQEKTYKPESSTMTSKTISSTKHFDINRRMVLAFLNVGLGHAGMCTFTEIMGMDSMTAITHTSHVSEVHKGAAWFSDETLDRAVHKIKELQGVNSDEVLDIAVSFDGSWHKRGHTSKHGVALVIEVETGLVVDFHVMTTYCHSCATIGAAKRKIGEAAYELWMQQHKAACTINHEGSSGMMEVNAAKVMWSRSLAKGLRYTTIVSDGDSKTYSALLDLKPYDVDVMKEECTNHVSKRLGTALRNLVSTQSKQGNTLGGRKAGSLTQVKINLLQLYYKKAVASGCSTVEELRRKIWQAFYHASSTDSNPKHQDCPTGKTSWCFWQRAIAYCAPPPSPKGKSSSFISEDVAKHVRPVYERLTSSELLSRCLKGLTQNTNESIHSSVWNKCPKHLFVGKKRIDIAVALAVGEFNSGSQSLRKFLTHSGCDVSTRIVTTGNKRDYSRIKKAERKETLEAKRRRTEMATAATLAQQEFVQKEGGRVYSSGAF